MNREEKNYYLGLDLGSVSLNCVITDYDGQIFYKKYKRTSGKPVETTIELFKEIHKYSDKLVFSGAVVTGSGKELISKATGIGSVNEIIAHATAAWTLYPDIKSVFEIGGQDSKYISIAQDKTGSHYLKDQAFNELCAAGTGAFLDQQADRLGLSVDQLSSLAASAENVAKIAGRCSVFAKSDMIHLQQKAAPVEEIASGLCFALARNYLATLCRGHIPPPPILFQGGVAANQGVIQAFREILHLTENDFIVPRDFSVMGALGSALIAAQTSLSAPLTILDLRNLLSKRKTIPPGNHPRKPLKNTLSRSAGEKKNSTTQTFQSPFFLGIDIGSVSTKGVITDSDKNIVTSSYIATSGRPIVALQSLFTELQKNSPDEINISHTVSTGSGRHISAALIDAGSIIDEISAQFVSANYFYRDVDTVIEIGGQDSKFIAVTGGRIDSFKMNRACAAGTGSFLEEQAGRLKINIANEFTQKAFAAQSPIRLGSRCTVFMDSDLVHHLQTGATTEDLCAGLAYSIGENYLEKVIGASTVGHTIVFQGGVAKNEAVKAVFEKLLNKKIKTHPYPEISGALGAAFTAQEEYLENPDRSSFYLNNRKIQAKTETFDCNLCDNNCEIRKLTVPNGNTACFGSICGRFEQSVSTPLPADDPFVVREHLLHDCVQQNTQEPSRGIIGIPLTLSLSDHLPFWGTFFNVLGFKIVYSDTSRREIIEDGLLHVPAEFCYPIKVLFGHVHNLHKKDVQKIFIPHLRLFTPPKEKKAVYACPYTQAAPYIVKNNLSFECDIIHLEYPLEEEMAHWIKSTSVTLAIDETTLQKSFEAASAAQENFSRRCIAAGKELLSALEKENRRGVVLVGRPYNTTDRYVNLNLARKLKKLNIEPIPFDFLPPEDTPLPELWDRIRWGHGRKLVQSVRVLKKYPFLGAVILTNFGCGPDSFIDQYLEYELVDTPHILIELDDHQAEAGLVTRLEAFSRNFTIRVEKRKTIFGKDPGKPRIPLREYTYYIPSFIDHAHAITGALKASGCKTVLLPPTDNESWNLGLQHAYGRECHPFISFTGDILKAAQHPDFIPEKSCYYGPSYFGPCLLPQYGLALHLILERVGLQGITVMNIIDPTNMKELGSSYIARVALGIYTIDRFFKWKTEIEPHERNKGEVERVYRGIIKELEKGLAEGSFFTKLKQSVKNLKTVKIRKNRNTRLKIGIVGDVYTRINEHSNNHLYDRLNDMGYEVWPACSLIDISFLGAEQLHVELMRKGATGKSLAARFLIPTVKIARWIVDRYFPATIRTPQERDFHAVSQISGKYADPWIDKVLSLNLSRIEELHLSGAAGIINAMCHNCMLGNITASLTTSMRKDMDNIPICNLVYEGLKSTHNINRLEAFTHQVTSCRATKQ